LGNIFFESKTNLIFQIDQFEFLGCQRCTGFVGLLDFIYEATPERFAFFEVGQKLALPRNQRPFLGLHRFQTKWQTKNLSTVSLLSGNSPTPLSPF